MSHDVPPPPGAARERTEPAEALSEAAPGGSAGTIATPPANPEAARPPRRCLNMAAHKLDLPLPTLH